MDRIQKELQKLSAKEFAAVKEVIAKLESGVIDELHVKKLKGHTDIYRVRIGNIRVIYRVGKEDIHLLAIRRRSDSTYREF
ncbi:MAG: type II toxin-antitoxin system RelE/ParE family toxin [Candidatus Paceibacterota bacterium]